MLLFNLVPIAVIVGLICIAVPRLQRRNVRSLAPKIAGAVTLLQAMLFIAQLIVASALGVQANPEGELWKFFNILGSGFLAPGHSLCVEFVPFFGIGGLLSAFVPILTLNFIFWSIVAGIICNFRKTR